jgi:hypothetical protein
MLFFLFKLLLNDVYIFTALLSEEFISITYYYCMNDFSIKPTKSLTFLFVFRSGEHVYISFLQSFFLFSSDEGVFIPSNELFI